MMPLGLILLLGLACVIGIWLQWGRPQKRQLPPLSAPRKGRCYYVEYRYHDGSVEVLHQCKQEITEPSTAIGRQRAAAKGTTLKSRQAYVHVLDPY